MRGTILVFFTFMLMIAVTWAGDVETKITPKGISEKESVKSAILPPCAACKVLTDSFKKGMERTRRSKFEGGDTAWEEEKLGKYATSEIRLTEVQEHLCEEVSRGQLQCQRSGEEQEGALEEWWFGGQQQELGAWLCEERLAVCCPKGAYGPQCLPCAAALGKPCAGHGRCRGDGTRKGNGSCACDPGYSGAACDTCGGGHHESYRDDTSLLCSPCHRACLGDCQGAGPDACLACAAGWRLAAGVCEDVNECAASDACQANTFCVNSHGSFSCLACDKSCDGCDGDGPDMCDKCAQGYVLDKEKGLCVGEDVEEPEDEVSQNFEDVSENNEVSIDEAKDEL